MNWIKIEERMPTEQESEDCLLIWWNKYECTGYPGEFLHYDGKWVVVNHKRWQQQVPLNEFSHWMILDKPEGTE